MEFHPLSVAVGASQKIGSVGQYIYYDSVNLGASNPEIRIRTDTSDEVRLMPGKGVRLGRPFTSFDVYNYAGVAAITGVLNVGAYDEESQDNRVSGEVSVIDGGKARTIADAAFFGQVGTGPTAAQYSCVQLWNPNAAGGKRAIVKAILATVGAAGTVFLAWTGTQMANAGVGAQSKKRGAASATLSTCLLGFQTAVAQATNDGASMLTLTFAAAGSFLIPFNEPQAVQPQTGLCLIASTVNMSVNGAFEFFEEAST